MCCLYLHIYAYNYKHIILLAVNTFKVVIIMCEMTIIYIHRDTDYSQVVKLADLKHTVVDGYQVYEIKEP